MDITQDLVRVELTLGSSVRDLMRGMASQGLDVVRLDLPDLKIPGTIVVLMIPAALADRLQPIIQREIRAFYED